MNLTRFFAKRRNKILFAVCLLLLAGFLAGIILNVVLRANGALPDAEFRHRLLYALLFFLVSAAILAGEAILRIRFPLVLELMLLVFVFACLMGGTVFGLYAHIPVWDKILHTASGVLFSAVGLSLAHAMTKGLSGMRRIVVCLLIAAFFSLSVGYLWEIYEFSYDSLVSGGNLQRWQAGILTQLPDGSVAVTDARAALLDTMYDLIVNLIGTVLFLAVMFFILRARAEILDAFAVERDRKAPSPQEEK